MLVCLIEIFHISSCRLGVLELLFSHMSSQPGMLRVVCFTNVHLIPMPLQVHEFPYRYFDCFVYVFG